MVLILFFTILCISASSQIHKLYIGAAEGNITPVLPVALNGQFNMRIAKSISTPLLANVVALEMREGERSVDQAIFVSCDLVGIPVVLTEMVRKQVHEQVPEIDVKKIILNATHTHTAPVFQSGFYAIPKQGVSQPEEYQQLFAQRVTDAIVKAWKTRNPGSVTWGLTTAVVGHNRRAVYTNGTAEMYGNTNVPEFQNFEGYEDHDVNSLFFWNNSGKLIATSIEVPCPAQEVEQDTTVNADYWHAVRVSLKKQLGSDLLVMGWIGAAGDQSPHLMYEKKAEERMRTLSKTSRIDAIAKRIVHAVDEAYETVKNDRHADAILSHKQEILTLPGRVVSEKEFKNAKAICDEIAVQMAANPKLAEKLETKKNWNGSILSRYEKQRENPNPTFDTEIHVLRLGDIAICTNQFELFTDFGIRMQTRSKALQTFVVQLAGAGSYLPTAKAMAGGGYSAVPQSNQVGAEGGQILVDRTLELISNMWPETK
ncbi:MAG: hypothetical protein M0Q53_15695 [Prolixibacteraceae bacterium]|nr:hypothetical protein [Prolixibacteraceae bacterium]